jgi:hypothetical protein
MIPPKDSMRLFFNNTYNIFIQYLKYIHIHICIRQISNMYPNIRRIFDPYPYMYSKNYNGCGYGKTIIRPYLIRLHPYLKHFVTNPACKSDRHVWPCQHRHPAA